MTRSDGGRANEATPEAEKPSAESAIRVAGKGTAATNSTEFGSTGAGGGVESFGVAGTGGGEEQSHPRHPQESGSAVDVSFTGSQQDAPEQQVPAPQQDVGTALAGTATGIDSGAGQWHDFPNAGATPIAVETARITHSTGW